MERDDNKFETNMVSRSMNFADSGDENMMEKNMDSFKNDNCDQETPLRSFESNSGSYDAFAHENEQQFPDGGWKAWSVVIGSCFGLMTVFGIMDTMASIQLYISKHQLADVKLGSISWIFSLYMFTNLAIGIFIGPIFDIYGIKKLLLVGMVLNCGGLYALAFSTELWHFILSFGICTGIGSGIMLTPLVGVVSHWFLKNRGWANGISECGSISGVFFPIMLRSLYPSLGYKKTMVIMASICVFLCAVCFATVEDRSDVLHSENSHIPKKQRLLKNI